MVCVARLFGVQLSKRHPMAATPLQKELRKISVEYRMSRLLGQLSICWGVLILVTLALLLLQREWAVYFPYALPSLALLGAIACVWVVLRSRHPLSLREIASKIERDNPALNSLLLAAIEQKPDPATGQLNYLQSRVVAEALQANRKSPWHQRFVERLFLMQCAHLLLFICACVSLMVLGKVTRVYLSANPTNAAPLEITPGNIELEKGSSIAVMARFNRQSPAEVSLVYKSASNGEQKMAMERSLSDPVFGANLMDLQEDVSYKVVQSGKASPEFKIHVFEYPELTRADAELDYPAYTKLQRARVEATRRITAVEGTRVDYTFHLNKPVRTAELRASDGTVLRLTNSPQEVTVWSAQFPLNESRDYELELIDNESRTNKVKADFKLVALKNERPKLKLKAPRGDQRVSALEEVRFEGEAQDDFGLTRYGLAYSFAGGKTELVDLSGKGSGDQINETKPHETRTIESLLPLEKHRAEPGQLVSYYLWAEDLGPDGNPRRTESDMYFAEVRPFEETFRESNSSSNSSRQQQQGQQSNPASKLLELQKQIISATWNLQRREIPGNITKEFESDATTVAESQENAISQARELKESGDERSRALVETAVRAMGAASQSLAEAGKRKDLKPLEAALKEEQSAYQALLKLQAHEYQVSRSRSRNGSQSGAQQRAQMQLDQLQLQSEENRYETESQAAPLQSPEQKESIQMLSRLKELAQRQQDMSERLKEIQAALNEAKTEEEKEKLRRELKRLQQEQQQIVQDTDDLRQRMAQSENQERMSEAKKDLDQSRQQAQQTAQNLQQGNVSQALSSSSRAQEQLQKLSDEFRKSTSRQFTEEMRQMRENARELDQKQQEIAQQMEQSRDSRQRTLSDAGPKKELMDALQTQKSSLTNLLQSMRQVTEQAETAEPLLSRQLYDSIRKASQARPEKALDLAQNLLDKNFLPQAQQAQENARETIHDLRNNLEKAAESVLGDESESLRFAQRELEKLTERVRREMTSAIRQGGTNVANTNAIGISSISLSTNQARLAQAPGSGTNQTATPSNKQGQGNQQVASNNQQRQDQNQSGESQSRQNENGNRSGNRNGSEQNSSAQLAQNETNSPDERGDQNNDTQNGQERSGQQQVNAAGNRNSGQQPNGGGGQGGTRRGNFFEQWATREGTQNQDGGGGDDGPIIGRDYARWSEGLRNVEETLQNPRLRTDLARVRERAREMRLEFKRNSTLPQWKEVQSDIVTPLKMLQNRIEEELAHIDSREAVAPVDRDPVPAEYAEWVNRYYEKLGKD